MIRLNQTVLKLTMAEVKDLDTRRRFHNYLRVEDNAARSSKTRGKQPDAPPTPAEPQPEVSSPGGGEVPNGTPDHNPSRASTPNSTATAKSASQPLGGDGLDEGNLDSVHAGRMRGFRRLDTLDSLDQPINSPFPAAPGSSTTRDQEGLRDRLQASTSSQQPDQVNRQHPVPGLGLADLVYSAGWGTSPTTPLLTRSSPIDLTATPAVNPGLEAGIGTGAREVGGRTGEGERRNARRLVPPAQARLRVVSDSLPVAPEFVTPESLILPPFPQSPPRAPHRPRAAPMTPARHRAERDSRQTGLRVYDDSASAVRQPQTPGDLPEARHQSHLLRGSLTLPARFVRSSWTISSHNPFNAPRPAENDTPSNQEDQNRRDIEESPPWLRRGRGHHPSPPR